MFTPAALTSATAGDHIDSITTSFETMKFTESVKADQNARNWPVSDGASMVSWRGLILEDSAMFANGLATTVCTWVRCATISSRPVEHRRSRR